ncbi:hypothetical protein CYMTET_13169 [Cymbomonas tetramitiformis]|uniref:Uncharacterized protein n=1 Tax=Cymbomonas tetramitiformis TaxID=36881 RepID=A0AAE0LB49_9CHLO|nr:hypothetical protein CYMTET_13169 [Cymbomonas tetramitiformis]
MYSKYGGKLRAGSARRLHSIFRQNFYGHRREAGTQRQNVETQHAEAERKGAGCGAEQSASSNGIFHDHPLLLTRHCAGSVKPRDLGQTAPPSEGGAGCSFSEAVKRAPTATTAHKPAPSPGEKRSGKPASVPPNPPRIYKKGNAAEQGTQEDEDIADLEYEDPWDQADGLDAATLEHI